MNDTPKGKTQDEIIKEAKERYAIALEAWCPFFQKAKTTLEFINGEQWDSQLRNTRENGGLPTLTANVLPSYIRQITNEARQNTPAIQIDPESNDSSVDQADIISDLTRGIEQKSNADTAYDTASWYAASTGLGYIRVITEYEDHLSFQQVAKIMSVQDPETVLLDPSHREIDGGDAEYGFIVTTLSKDEYIRQYGESSLAESAKTSGWDTAHSQWVREDEVIIVEYYSREYVKTKLYKVYNTQTNSLIISVQKPIQDLVDDGTLIIEETRFTQVPTIYWYKLNDKEILESTVWPGLRIPIVPVKGDETWVGGKRVLKGAVEDAIDSQKAFNYFFSLGAELVSLAPKAPFIGAAEQFADYEELWKNANTTASSFLPYNPIEVNGTVLPPPQRTAVGADISAAMGMVGQAKDNIKSVFGIFDASLGAGGNETSGKAILARTEQSNKSTYHFYDNLTKSISAVGRILLEIIPVIYNETDRQVQLVKRSGQVSPSKINSEPKPGEKNNDITYGTYGVTVETGPSYATRRQDSVDHMLTLGTAMPQAMPLIADIIADESDWPGSKRIADRLRLALPKEVQEAEAAGGKITDKAQAQLAISQVKTMSQQLQQLNAHAQQTEDKLKNVEEENKLLKLKASIDLEKVNKDYEVKMAQIDLDKQEASLSYQIKQQELAQSERALRIQEIQSEVGIIESQHDMVKDRHDRDNGHIERVKVPSVSDGFGPNGPEGLDKSFSTLSGGDLDNA